MVAVELKDDVYRRRVILAVGSVKELKEMLTRSYGKGAARGIPNDAGGMMHTFKWYSEDFPEMGKKSKVFVIWLLRFTLTPLDISTLAHECFHCASAVLDELGVDTDDSEGSEALAYYLDSLVRRSLIALGGSP